MGMIKVPAEAQQKFLANFGKICDTGALAEGEWNAGLGRFFMQYVGSRAAIPFSSNGSGLLATLMLLRRYRGFKHVFIQSNTMYGVKTIAITSGLEYVGAVPCTLATLMPSAGQVRAFVAALPDPASTIFLTSHIGGIVNPDIEEICRICAAAGVGVVEDCAHSVGATLRGKHSGLFGIAGVYSLYATKAIAAGEGGIAVTNDEELADLLGRFNIYDRFDRQQEIGVNFRVSEIQALFSLCVCECSEDIIANKTRIAERYAEACRQAGVRFVDPFQPGQRANHYKFSLIADRDVTQAFAHITQRTSPVYDYTLGEDPELVHRRHICVPVWYGLEEQIVDQTCSQIMKGSA